MTATIEVANPVLMAYTMSVVMMLSVLGIPVLARFKKKTIEPAMSKSATAALPNPKQVTQVRLGKLEKSWRIMLIAVKSGSGKMLFDFID